VEQGTTLALVKRGHVALQRPLLLQTPPGYHTAPGTLVAPHPASTGVKRFSQRSWWCRGKEELLFQYFQKQLKKMIIVT